MIVDKIKISRFKSIKNMDLTLNSINILIGQNGAGKSNFIQFFNLLNNIVSSNLQNYVAVNGGADNFLHFGRKYSESIQGSIFFGRNGYEIELSATVLNNFIFSKEITHYTNPVHYGSSARNISDGNSETNLIHEYKKGKSEVINYILHAMTSWRVYHFHDTSVSAKIKQDGDINDNRTFRKDGSNLASFLYLLKEKHLEHFLKIESTIKFVAPFFEKFQLEPLRLNEEKIKLEWKHLGNESYFNASHLSDGTLRMICLITLFLQPSPPDTIIIDEPELGLHPAAIQLLASLMKSFAADHKQIICSTQSVTLLNHFDPDDIIVVDRDNSESVFRKLHESELENWLNNYAIGELWEKNVLGGRP